MSNLKQYIIPFIGLKQGKHLFNYEIDNTFFEAFGFNEFNNSSLQVALVFEKKTTFFELNFEVRGVVFHGKGTCSSKATAIAMGGRLGELG